MRWSSSSPTAAPGPTSCGAVPGDAKAGSRTTGVLKLTAANPGAWAEDLRVVVTPASKAKTQVLAVSGADLTLKNADGFNPGDVGELFDGKTAAHATVKSVLDKVVTLDAPCTLDVADTKVGTAKYIKTCEITLTARLGETVETFENLSLKPDALNNVCVKTAKSDLICVEVTAAKAPAAPAPKEKDKDGKEIPAPAPKAASIVPYELCGGSGSELVLTLQGGSNGSVLTVTPDALPGQGRRPGQAHRPAGLPGERQCLHHGHPRRHRP